MSMGVWKTWATVAAVAILLELMACVPIRRRTRSPICWTLSER